MKLIRFTIDRGDRFAVFSVNAIALFSAINMALSAFAICISMAALHRSSISVFDKNLLYHANVVAKSVKTYERVFADEQAHLRNAYIRKAGSSLYNVSTVIGSHEHSHVVEFIDYTCTFCKASYAALEQQLRFHPGRSVAVRQLPIISGLSRTIAEYALAAEKQGKFAVVHGDFLKTKIVSESDILAVLKRDRVDIGQARLFVHSAECQKLLGKDLDVANRLAIHATPSFVVDGTLVEGWKPDAILRHL